MAENILKGLQVQIRANATPFATEMDKAAAKAKSSAREMSSAVKKEMKEATHSMALFGEETGVKIPRHIRSFIASMPGVGKAMSAAFDTLAVVMVITVLVEAGKKVYELAEAYKKMGEAPEHIKEGFISLNGELQAHNDRMALTNDNLRAAIAKLEGKPVNNLAIALDEARVHADELGSSLEKDIKKTFDLLEKNKASWIQKTFLGVSGDEDLADQNTAYGKQRTELSQEHQAKLHTNLTPKQTEEENAEYYKHDQGLIKARRDWLSGQIGATNTEKGNLNAIGGDGGSFDSRLYKLRGLMANTFQESDADKQDQDNQGLQGKFKTDTTNKENATAAETARKKRIAESKRLDDVEWKDYEEAATRSTDHHKRSLAETLDYYAAHQTLREGNKLKQQDKNADTEDEQDKQDIAALNKYNDAQNHLSDKLSALREKDSHSFMSEVSKAGALTNQWIAFNEKLGVSHTATSNAITTAHTQEFNALQKILVAERDRIAAETAGERTPDELAAWNESHKDKLKGANHAITAGQEGYELQHKEDLHLQQIQTASAGFKQFFDDFEKNADNAGKAVHEALSIAMNGVNSELTKAMMGEKTNWSGAFKQTGSSMINSGLKSAESLLFKSADGSAFKPFHVIMAGMGLATTGASGAATGFMGSLGKYAHMMGFANGGNPDPYKTSIVGENGPELFTPRGVAGHITSNRDSFGSGGGGNTTIHQTIDATGTNAAETEMRVRQGSMAAYSQAMQDGPKAQAERSRRRPGGR